jgi:hypothetical protein
MGGQPLALDHGTEVVADVGGVYLLEQSGAGRVDRGHRHSVRLGTHRRRHRHIITHRTANRQIGRVVRVLWPARGRIGT